MDATALARYREQFARTEPRRAAREGPWLRAARAGALERFAALGFPTTRQEDWKYTDVRAIERHAFAPAPDGRGRARAAEVNALALPGAPLAVFADGRLDARRSRLDALPAGVTVKSLATLLADDPDSAAARLGVAPEALASGFDALNAAFWTDGAYVEIAPRATVPMPLHLLYVGTLPDAATYVRTLVHACPGSRASIVEHFATLHDGAALTVAQTRVVLERGARLEHCKLQEESARVFHVGALDVRQGERSALASRSFALGAALSRTDVATRFDGAGCDAVLDGLYVVAGRQHVDHHTCIDHSRAHCTSRETYRGVLADAARAVFNGRVIVRPGAHKTDAHQSNRNLLLSAAAEVDTKPQLEIYADDVKCTHGATVGTLDDQQLFYLRSRGIAGPAARRLLVQAFVSEIVARCSVAPLRERLPHLIADRLDGAPGGAMP